MKKLMLMTCASAFAGLMAVAETETVNGVEWYYEVKDGHAVLGGGYNAPAISKDAEGKIVIPEKLGGYDVTAISDFAFSARRPWREKITSVTIPNSVTNIGSYAFSGCRELADITIPNGMKSIGYGAFHNCRRLSSLALPESVTKIGERAFKGCDGLATNGFVIVRGVLYSYCGDDSEVVVPNGVTHIDQDGFKGCNRLSSIILPEGLTDIYNSTFDNCEELTNVKLPATLTRIGMVASGDMREGFSRPSFSVAEGNPRYAVVDGMLYDKIDNIVVRGTPGLGDVVLPQNTKIIAPGAFVGCGGITRVTVPQGVTRIYGGTFYGCTNLTHISLPTTVTNIGYEVFSDCPIHTFAVDKANERYAEYNSLLYDKKEDAVVRGTMPLREIAFPSTTKTINWRAFEGCTNLVDAVIPKSVSEIYDDAFKNCTALENVRIEKGAAIDELREVFGGCVKLRHVDLGDSIKSLVNNIFSGCASLERVEIPDSVETMECGVFLDCTNLTYVKIGKNLQVPDNDYFSYNFEGCRQLGTIEVDQANTNLCVVDGFVYNKEKTMLLFCPCAATKDTLVIPDGVTVVADIVSRGCDVLQRVIVPQSVTNMGKTASRAKLFTEYVVDERNKFYSSVGGLLLDKKVETLVACASGCKGHVQVPETVKKIKDEAFAFCEGITSVTIPDSVTEIRWAAFYGCKCLKNVSLPKALKGKINEKDVFRECATDLKIVYRD